MFKFLVSAKIKRDEIVGYEPVEIEVDFYCCDCGSGMCSNITQRKPGSDVLYISPCEGCLKTANQEGLEEGYVKGYDEGLLECCDGDHTDE